MNDDMIRELQEEDNAEYDNVPFVDDVAMEAGNIDDDCTCEKVLAGFGWVDGKWVPGKFCNPHHHSPDCVLFEDYSHAEEEITE